MLFLIVLLSGVCSCGEEKSLQNENVMDGTTLFVGTYTKKEGHVDGKGEGVYSFDLKGDSILTRTKMVNPSFIEISKDGKFLYAVNELGSSDGPSGLIAAYKINAITKELHFLNQQETNGFAPCHITLDEKNALAIVSNYVGGVVSVFPLKENGELGEKSQVLTFEGFGSTDRQEASHPHSSIISPNGNFVYIADLGTDLIRCFKIDYSKKTLLPIDKATVKITDGAGPRHMDFHPTKNILYVVNELNGTVSVFNYNNNSGALAEWQSKSTLPDRFEDFNLCADIHVHPSGQYLYVSNRGHNSIVVFRINEKDGGLEQVSHTSTEGDFPRNFAIENDGKYLWVANQNTDNIIKFEINMNTGDLKKVDELKIPTPVCLKFY